MPKRWTSATLGAMENLASLRGHGRGPTLAACGDRRGVAVGRGPSSRRAGTLALLVLLHAPPSLAGECTEGGPAFYIELLEQVAAGQEKIRGEDPFTCLDIRLGMTNRWAGPRAARTMARFRRSPLRGRLTRACARILSRGNRWTSRSCVRLLAAHGVRAVGGRDVFTLQQKLFAQGLDPAHLASLGDPRAVPQLIARFSEARACTERPGRNGAAIRDCVDFSEGAGNRWIRRRHQEHKIAVLNALWHLAAPSSRTFLEQLIRRDPDKLLRQRASAVLSRLPPA